MVDENASPETLPHAQVCDPEGNPVNSGKAGGIVDVANPDSRGNTAEKYSHLRATLPKDGTIISFLFTDAELKRARARALKHKEMLPETTWIRDFLENLGL